MTYGWAILVVLVAISALAYFGVLDVDRFLPSMCTLPAGLHCVDFSVEYNDLPDPLVDENHLNLVIRNNRGNKIYLTHILVEESDFDYDLTSIHGADGLLVENSNPVTENVLRFNKGSNPQPAKKSGETITLTLRVQYTNDETNLPHSDVGYIRGKVQ